MGVYIGAVKDDYSAMQGPSPSGFHVPTKDEWVGLYNIGISLGAWTSRGGNNFRNYLKLPFAGYRLRSSVGISGNGTNGQYATSEKSGTNNSYKLLVNGSNIQASSDYTTFGYSARCFKDVPTVPTSSWTKLYGTSIESGGIFWNSTDGLISLSSDGQTWITIMDKNLGATTVYNNGDTLSEANCGRYFQWGNNYGFPGIGNSETITTSSGQVNAKNYGPGNYYSSSTFITRSSSPFGWDSSNNYNLWGGVTGAKPTSLKNAYIGDVRGTGNASGLISKSSMGVDSTCRGVFMSNDGTHFYKALESGRAIVHYVLSIPYDLSTASQVYSRSTDMQNQIFFDFTGKYLYTSGVKQYTLGTNWDISTATQTGTLAVNFPQGGCRLCQVIDDTHLWLAGSYNGAGNQCMVTLSAPNDLSNVTRVYTTRASTDRMVRNHNGTRVLFSNYGSSVALQQGVCTTPYDITTLTSIETVLTGLRYPYYAYTNYDKGLVLGTENNTAYYYELPNS